MNRLAVGRSARAQQAHNVNNRINRLMPLHKTDADTQTTAMYGDTQDTIDNTQYGRIRILGLPGASSGRQ